MRGDLWDSSTSNALNEIIYGGTKKKMRPLNIRPGEADSNVNLFYYRKLLMFHRILLFNVIYVAA